MSHDALELLTSPPVMAAGLTILAVVLFVWALRALVGGSERRARKAGLYPAPGAGTDADIGRLLDAGETALAVKLYRELYHVDLKSAQAVVEELGGGRRG